MARADSTSLPRSRAALIAVAGAGAVWYVGFDPFWAVAAVMAAAAIGAAVANFGSEQRAGWEVPEEEAAWDLPRYETPPGVRRDVAAITGSLAACDRLARPRAVRRMRALLIPEREDRVASTTAVRRMCALLNAELSDRGLDPGDRSDVVALLGPDAIAILHPNDGEPVTTAAIERCLDAAERLGTGSQG
jgi:hypothetical protein